MPAQPWAGLRTGFQFDTTYTRLPEVFFTHLAPEPVADPAMVILNSDLAAELGLDFSAMSDDDMAQLFAGNHLPEGATPFAQAYAGHQFGHFTILGDGRAIVWGEFLTPDGRRFDVQYKGSGRTPYSRRGDGRAALGPMLREFILAEAMYALGIPTTRSLAVALTGERVLREEPLPGAVLTRVAASHIRVGTFEFAAAHQKLPLLQALLDYSLDRHYPVAKGADNPALALLHDAMTRQIDLVVNWMRVGFIHGVMNTDNMALSGETIDYGPCAFMDAYDPRTVFSSIDHHGRYAYGNQPAMAQWNLIRLAEALLPLIHQDMKTAIAMAERVIETFDDLFGQAWLRMMRQKLGLMTARDDDQALISELLNWMQRQGADYTNTFRDLSLHGLPDRKPYDSQEFCNWYRRWQARLACEPVPHDNDNDNDNDNVRALMGSANPAVIPRNHHVEQVLNAADSGDMSPLQNLLRALQSPYTERPELVPYQSPPQPEERVYQTFCGT